MQSEFGVPVEMNPGIDILPGAPAVRRRFEAVPYNGSSFSPESTVQIYLPTGGASTFIDPHRSYLRFDVVNKIGDIGSDLSDFTFTLPPGLNNAGGSGASFWLDPSIGAQNFIREFRTFQSGLPLEEITDYDNLATVIAETEFGDAINSGLALQMWGAGGCYRPHYGSSAFSGSNPTRQTPAYYPVEFQETLYQDTTNYSTNTTMSYPNTQVNPRDTLSGSTFDTIVNSGKYLGDVYLKFLKPSVARATAGNPFGTNGYDAATSANSNFDVFHNVHGRDGYTNHTSLLLSDGPANGRTAPDDDADHVVVKGIAVLGSARRRINTTDGTVTDAAGTVNGVTHPKAYDMSHDIQKILNNHVCNLSVPSELPYWHGILAGSDNSIYPGMAIMPDMSGIRGNGISSMGFLGGSTSSLPFWKRAVCIPSSGLATKLSSGQSSTASTFKQANNTDEKGTGALEGDSAVTNSITVCIPIISGIVGIDATKYFPSMLLASQSFYIELRLADYMGAIGNALNANAIVAYGNTITTEVKDSRAPGNDNIWLGGTSIDQYYPLAPNARPSFSINNGYSYDAAATPPNSGQQLYVEGKKLLTDSNFAQQTSWQLQNIAFVGEEIIATPELTNELFSIAARQPIRWTTTSYRNYSQYITCTSSQDNFDLVLPCTLQSVQKLYHTFRMKDTLSNPLYRRNFRVNPAILSWQYRIGAEVFPQQPHRGKELPDMYEHPQFGCRSAESAVELLKSLHLTTGQGTNFVDGFSDADSWNASLESQQIMMKPVFRVSDDLEAAKAKSKAAVFPMSSSYAGTTNYEFAPDYSSGTMLGSYLLGFDFNVYGGPSGTSRCGRSFQSDQVNMIFSLGSSKGGIRTDGIFRTPFVKEANVPETYLSTQVSDQIVQVPESSWPLSATYQDTVLLMNTIAKCDMVITVMPEGTMQVAY